jgi:hypothetical protein
MRQLWWRNLVSLGLITPNLREVANNGWKSSFPWHFGLVSLLGAFTIFKESLSQITLRLSTSLHRRLDVEFEHKSQSITFSEWLFLLTLCFAPLATHLLVGVPEPTVFVKLPWQQRICHFNPTSILWRYFAIADRRARARKWGCCNLAATNAVFWDGTHWDGSEEKMARMRGKATKLPSYHRVSVFSTSALGTLIITLQGIQAIYDLIVNAIGSVHPGGHPISKVFFPLAIFGLIRLPAALWLTEEYGYRECKETEPPGEGYSEFGLLPPPGHIIAGSNIPSQQFCPQCSCRGILTRAIFMGVLIALMALTLCFFALNFKSDTRTDLTTFVSQIFYLFYLACTFAIVSTFILAGKGNTTIIPCIQSTWYQAYTYMLFSLALRFILVSALETRRTTCGLYTAIPIDWGQDGLMCHAYLV